MATGVYWDILEKPPQFNRTLKGWEIERVCRVIGCSGVHRVAQVDEAIIASELNIGSVILYEGLPNCVCEEIHPGFLNDSPDTVDLTFLFRQRYAEPEIVVDTLGVEEETCYCLVGGSPALMNVTYTPSEGPQKSDNILAPKVIPCTRVTLTRMELNVGSGIAAYAGSYVGKVNSGGFSMMGAGALSASAESQTWLCNSIRARSNDNINYVVTYEMVYKADKFIHRGVHLDPKTSRLPGDVPSDIEPGEAHNGSYPVRDFVLYETADFSALALYAT